MVFLLAGAQGCGTDTTEFGDPGGTAGNGGAPGSGGAGTAGNGTAGSGAGQTGGGMGSGAGGSGGSASGGAGSGGDGGAPPTTSCAAGDAAAMSNNVLLWTTNNDDMSIITPMVGQGTGKYTGTFVAALSADGLEIDESGDVIEYPQANNVSFGSGALDFCYRPILGHEDDQNRVYFMGRMGGLQGTGSMLIHKNDENALSLSVTYSLGGPVTQVQWQVRPMAYSMTAGQWTRLTFSWSFAGAFPDVHIYQDGVELMAMGPPNIGPIILPGGSQEPILFGSAIEGTTLLAHANGAFDDIVVYDRPITP